MERTKKRKISEQVEEHAKQRPEKKPEYDGNVEKMISTGSTLMDLAISGGRVRGGGLPGGILVEISGLESSGKTVMLCQIAGNVQKQGGQIMFRDPEARLNKQFATIFGLDTSAMDYVRPHTVPEVFAPIREWKPDSNDRINGVFADSLAALSTEMELEDKDGMGMRRAKEFSEQLRLTCITITEKNFLVVCSNQLRENINAGPYGQKYKTPGGKAIPYYSSLRLRCSAPEKIKEVRTISKKEMKRVVGVETTISVIKSSVWNPYREAPVSIIFDYGIDDIRENLKFVKQMKQGRIYAVGEIELSNSLNESIRGVEELALEDALREQTIDMWEEVEAKFHQERKPKI